MFRDVGYPWHLLITTVTAKPAFADVTVRIHSGALDRRGAEHKRRARRGSQKFVTTPQLSLNVGVSTVTHSSTKRPDRCGLLDITGAEDHGVFPCR